MPITRPCASSSGQGSVGIGFAVPINIAKRLLPQLRQGKEIQRAYLGVQMAAVNDQVQQKLNLPVGEGALITDAVKGGPAAEAWLRAAVSSPLEIRREIVPDGRDVVAEAFQIKEPGDAEVVDADDRVFLVTLDKIHPAATDGDEAAQIRDGIGAPPSPADVLAALGEVAPASS